MEQVLACVDCGKSTSWSGLGRKRMYCDDCRLVRSRASSRASRKRLYAADPEKFKAARREQEKRKRRCAYPECRNPQVHADGLCRSHHSRLVRTGSADGLVQRQKRNGVDAQGYRRSRKGGRMVLEHRAVMAQILGRPLLPSENVHHINGDRLDNRPENLELWSKSQPSGQRVTDKVAWAIELLRLYAPDELREPCYSLGPATYGVLAS